MRGALDLGVNLFDTARSYGESEARLGRALAGRRHEARVSTKVGYGVQGVPDWTRECVRRGIDEALARLQTDHLDIVHLHSCPRETLERGEVVEALVEAKRAGKVVASAYSGDNEALAFAVQSGAFDVVQLSLNVVDQGSIEGWLPGGLLRIAKERGLGVLAKRALANSVWRFAQRPTAPDHREYWTRLAALGIEAPRGMPWPAAALRFTLGVSEVDVAIVGTSRLSHLEEACRWASEGALEPLQHAALRAAWCTRGNWPGVV